MFSFEVEIMANKLSLDPIPANSEELATIFGTVFEDEELLQAVYQMREGTPDWMVHVRRRLITLMREAIGQNQIQLRIGELSEEIRNLAVNIKSYQIKIERRVADLLPPGDLKERFESEYPDEKRKIASYVAETIFSRDRRCFLQASTFILHLAEVLKDNGNGKGSAIHTNSTVFPWLLLGRGAKYFVYTVCGRIHDPLCCGWLFGADDDHATEYVRSLFHRGKDPLDLAIVTPQHITLNGKLYFAKEETAELVELLASVSKELVVLSPLQRIRNCRDDLRNNDHMWAEVDLSAVRSELEGENNVEWIFCGETSKGVESSNVEIELAKVGNTTFLP